MQTLNTPSASGGGSFGKIFFWVAVMVVALMAGICSTVKAQSTTQVISLLFHGGTVTNPGDFRWEKDDYLLNNGTTNGTAQFDFFDMDGNPLVVTYEGTAALSSHVFALGPGQSVKLKMTSTFGGQIKVFRGRVTLSANMVLVADDKMYAMLQDRTVNFFDFGRLTTSSIPKVTKGNNLTIFPVITGVVQGFSQRKPTISLVNDNQTTANIVVKLFQTSGAQLGSFNMTLAPNAQNFVFLDDKFPGVLVDGGRVTITANVPVDLAALQFLNAAFLPIDIFQGVFVPAVAPVLNVEAPVEGQTFTGTGTNLNVQIGGWAVVPGGNVAARPIVSEAGTEAVFGVDVSLDGGVSFFVPLDVARQDVVDAFAGQGIAVPLKCGFSFSRLVANGNHSVRVVATNDVGVTTEQIVNFVVRLTQPPPNFDGNYAGDLDSGASTPAGMSAHWVMTISGGKITKLEIQNWHLTSCNEGPQDAGVAVIQTINGTTNVNVIVDSGGNFQMGPRLCDQLTGRFVGTTVEILYIRFSSCKVTLNCTSPSSVTSVVKLTRQ
ncbi:MAG: hypothetical protein A3I32_02180 [Candidatus Yanofskybacteria bacterium RIFCSPLOWO2_02_FULL_45_10]|uniref:Uncharacterized protein n=2 Tax=Candidatus Yanofskyibacteriota TaxID=1752733 RepID=A0A1F8G5G9_9BACT|nr:MAG: hypothetical protein A3F25_01570 [Candidatus Yanofskybacteria bacterium RIFCSPHIGHO2_12_FULL_45_19b]OGN31912.1 MAG: hypothetical protein A3I32_02180 [Candidatus Yanofskybacteria bacterium RIFCSPLOWO2_02_FULL_45_10]